MSILRKKKFIISSCMAVMVIIAFQHHINTKAYRWDSVLLKFKSYQNQLQKSINFTSLQYISSPISKSNALSARKHLIPRGILNEQKDTIQIINQMFDTSKKCLRHSKRDIAVYLHKTYQKEFSRDHIAKKIEFPILEPQCKPGFDLIIILTTRPGAFYRRTGIRNSWGRSDSHINKILFKDSLFTYMTIFTIGRTENNKIEGLIEDENTRFKDILRLDYSDTYGNLVNKTIQTLDWVSKNCQPKYLLKTDDDCFVNIKELSTWMQNLKSSTKYIGRKNEYMPVIRDPLHRNYVPFEDYKEEFYKPYCAGGGYMLSGDILKNLTEKSREIKQIINEDAYIGMVTHVLNITPVDEDRFLPFIFSKKSARKRFMCEWRDKFLMHGVMPETQLKMHWNYIAMINHPSLCQSLSSEDFE